MIVTDGLSGAPTGAHFHAGMRGVAGPIIKNLSSIAPHLRCRFRSGAPVCESHVAIGGSLLIFTGNPGKLTNGTGIYQGATGRVVSSKQVPGGDDASDIVASIQLRG